MNYKSIAMKISVPMLVAGLMLGNADGAEENKYFLCKKSPTDKGDRYEFSEFEIEGSHYVRRIHGVENKNAPCQILWLTTISRVDGKEHTLSVLPNCVSNESDSTCELKTEKLKF